MALPDRYEYKVARTDTLVKTGEGVLHTLTVNSDAAATAGSVVVRDGTDSNGTEIITLTFPAQFIPAASLLLDLHFKTGLYLDFATTDDVAVLATYK